MYKVFAIVNLLSLQQKVELFLLNFEIPSNLVRMEGG